MRKRQGFINKTNAQTWPNPYDPYDSRSYTELEFKEEFGYSPYDLSTKTIYNTIKYYDDFLQNYNQSLVNKQGELNTLTTSLNNASTLNEYQNLLIEYKNFYGDYKFCYDQLKYYKNKFQTYYAFYQGDYVLTKKAYDDLYEGVANLAEDIASKSNWIYAWDFYVTGYDSNSMDCEFERSTVDSSAATTFDLIFKEFFCGLGLSVYTGGAWDSFCLWGWCNFEIYAKYLRDLNDWKNLMKPIFDNYRVILKEGNEYCTQATSYANCAFTDFQDYGKTTPEPILFSYAPSSVNKKQTNSTFSSLQSTFKSRVCYSGYSLIDLLNDLINLFSVSYEIFTNNYDDIAKKEKDWLDFEKLKDELLILEVPDAVTPVSGAQNAGAQDQKNNVDQIKDSISSATLSGLGLVGLEALGDALKDAIAILIELNLQQQTYNQQHDDEEDEITKTGLEQAAEEAAEEDEGEEPGPNKK